MPLHDSLQHGSQEPTISASLVLGAAGDGVGDITEDPVVADQGGEVGSLELVDDVDKLGSIDCIPEETIMSCGKPMLIVAILT